MQFFRGSWENLSECLIENVDSNGVMINNLLDIFMLCLTSKTILIVYIVQLIMRKHAHSINQSLFYTNHVARDRCFVAANNIGAVQTAAAAQSG